VPCGGTLGTTATTGLFYQPRMIGHGDCGKIGGIKIGRGNRSTRRKLASAPLCPPQILHDKTRVWTWAAAVWSQQLFFLLLFGLWGYSHCGHFWPIVPASGDSEDDCGEADGMYIGRRNRSSRRKPSSAPLLSITKSHMTRPGSEPGPQWCEARNCFFIIIWFVRLLALRPLLAYCASLGW
jgi:hypothetical protein